MSGPGCQFPPPFVTGHVLCPVIFYSTSLRPAGLFFFSGFEPNKEFYPDHLRSAQPETRRSHYEAFHRARYPIFSRTSASCPVSFASPFADRTDIVRASSFPVRRLPYCVHFSKQEKHLPLSLLVPSYCPVNLSPLPTSRMLPGFGPVFFDLSHFPGSVTFSLRLLFAFAVLDPPPHPPYHDKRFPATNPLGFFQPFQRAQCEDLAFLFSGSILKFSKPRTVPLGPAKLGGEFVSFPNVIAAPCSFPRLSPPSFPRSHMKLGAFPGIGVL